MIPIRYVKSGLISGVTFGSINGVLDYRSKALKTSIRTHPASQQASGVAQSLVVDWQPERDPVHAAHIPMVKASKRRCFTCLNGTMDILHRHPVLLFIIASASAWGENGIFTWSVPNQREQMKFCMEDLPRDL